MQLKQTHANRKKHLKIEKKISFTTPVLQIQKRAAKVHNTKKRAAINPDHNGNLSK